MDCMCDPDVWGPDGLEPSNGGHAPNCPNGLSGTADRAERAGDYPQPPALDPDEVRALMDDMATAAQNLREAMLRASVTMREAAAGMDALGLVLREIDWSAMHESD